MRQPNPLLMGRGKRGWKCCCLRAKANLHVAVFDARYSMAELVSQESAVKQELFLLLGARGVQHLSGGHSLSVHPPVSPCLRC